MTKFVRMIIEKIERTDVVTNKGPSEIMRPGETPEFILEDEELRKLYIILMQASRNLERAVIDARRLILDCEEKGQDPRKDTVVAKAEQKAVKLAPIYTTIRNLFWNSFAHEYPLYEDKACGIREGWQVVSCPKDNVAHDLGSMILGISKDFAEKFFRENPGLIGGKKTTLH